MFKARKLIQKLIALAILLSALAFFSRETLAGFWTMASHLKFPSLLRAASDRPQKPRPLREIAMEKDVEIEGSSGCDHLKELEVAGLIQSSSAIMLGRIIQSNSFFEDSGAPQDAGEDITTHYQVEVLGVLKNATTETMLPPDKPKPAPLVTPLKIARNGGEVTLNGHRAAVKVRGYERLTANRQYVFFLNWSPDYKAYNLTYCLFGAVLVNDDQSLTSLGPSKQFQKELETYNLEKLIAKISRP